MKKKGWIFFFVLLYVGIFSAQTKLSLFTFKEIDEIVPLENKKSALASIMTALEEERKKTAHHFTVLNGDFISPLCLSGIDQGAHVIDLLNSFKIDLVICGNHEFDFGPKELKKRIEESNFKWLSSNIIGLEEETFKGCQQVAIYEMDGIKVGFFGLISEQTCKLSKTGGEIYFLSTIEAAKQRCEELKKEQVDVIIALCHLSLEEIKGLVKEVPQIHLILGGHDQELVSFLENDTLVYNIGKANSHLCRLDFILEKKENLHSEKINIYPSFRTIDFSKVEPSLAILDKIQYYQYKYKNELGENLAVLKTDLDATFETIRTQETALGNLVADAIREYSIFLFVIKI